MSPEIVEMLKTAYAAEVQSVEDFLATSVWLDGPGSRQIAQALDVYIPGKLIQAKKIARRLKQLGVNSPASFASTQKILPPPDHTDPLPAVEGVLEAQRQAISRCEKLIRACERKDFATQELAMEILADEERHRALFEGFLVQLNEQRKTKPLNLRMTD